MNESKHSTKSRKRNKGKEVTKMLVVRRIDTLTSDLEILSNHYGMSNESQVVRTAIRELASKIGE